MHGKCVFRVLGHHRGHVREDGEAHSGDVTRHVQAEVRTEREGCKHLLSDEPERSDEVRPLG